MTGLWDNQLHKDTVKYREENLKVQKQELSYIALFFMLSSNL